MKKQLRCIKLLEFITVCSNALQLNLCKVNVFLAGQSVVTVFFRTQKLENIWANPVFLIVFEEVKDLMA